MYLSYEQAQLRKEYILRCLKKLARGKVSLRQGKYETVYVSRCPGHPEYNRRRFSTNTERGRRLKSQVELRRKLQSELPSVDAYLKNPPPAGEVAATTLNYDTFFLLATTANSNPFPLPKYAPEYNGIKYRSKSEALIAKTIDDMNYEFLYEPSTVTCFEHASIYPDFAVYVPEIDKVFFIEHFGKWGDIDYTRKAHERIDEYIANGLLPGRDVIFTYESDEIPFDPGVLMHQINALILANTRADAFSLRKAVESPLQDL
ncbi:MAG: hypothetical protein K6F79_03255 [Saccharofermentans sp.]|nr:hypothetical protein [Saccharofermentans sp.]